MVVLAAVQAVEIRPAVDAEQHGLAVDTCLAQSLCDERGHR
jgi:hypothetical protein